MRPLTFASVAGIILSVIGLLNAVAKADDNSKSYMKVVYTSAFADDKPPLPGYAGTTQYAYVTSSAPYRAKLDVHCVTFDSATNKMVPSGYQSVFVDANDEVQLGVSAFQPSNGTLQKSIWVIDKSQF